MWCVLCCRIIINNKLHDVPVMQKAVTNIMASSLAFTEYCETAMPIKYIWLHTMQNSADKKSGKVHSNRSTSVRILINNSFSFTARTDQFL